MRKLLKYDLLYLRKTQKFTVFIALFVIFSILSPLTLKYINEILSLFLSSGDVTLNFTDPTVFTAYEQYISDLYETIFFVVLFVSVNIFIRDKTKKLLVLVFSKPVDRTKYILSKYLTMLFLLAISVIAGYLMFTYYTYFLFDEVFFLEGLAMMGLYFLYLAFIMSVALFFSTISKSYLIAILPTFGVYLLVTILTILGEVTFFEYLPGMLIRSIIGILYDINVTVDVIWNILVTLLFTGLFLGGSIWKIQSIDVT